MSNSNYDRNIQLHFIKHLVQPDRKWLQTTPPQNPLQLLPLPYLHGPPHYAIVFLAFVILEKPLHLNASTISTTAAPKATNASGANKPPKHYVVNKLCKHYRPCNTK